jgi:hypothetical protein
MKWQNELIPGMTGSNAGPANGNFGQRKRRFGLGRQNKLYRGHLGVVDLGKQTIERHDDLVGITLHAGHALGQKAAIDGPAFCAVHVTGRQLQMLVISQALLGYARAAQAVQVSALGTGLLRTASRIKWPGGGLHQRQSLALHFSWYSKL